MKQEVNLYQLGSKEKKISWIGIVSILALLSLSGVLTGMSLYTRAQCEDWNRKLQAARQQRDNLKKQVEELEQKVSTQDYKQLRERIQKLGNKKDARQKLLEVLSKTGSRQQKGFAPFLEVLSRQDVSRLWLTRFRIDLGKEPSLYLEGKTTKSERIPEYFMHLSREKIFSGYRFEKLSAERVDDPAGIISFTLGTEND